MIFSCSKFLVSYIAEPPEVEFLKDKTTVENSSTVTLKWHILYDGNLPVGRFRLEKSPSSSDESLGEVDHDIPGNATEYTVYNLLPGIAYTFSLSAHNVAGSSDEDFVNISMPSDGM